MRAVNNLVFDMTLRTDKLTEKVRARVEHVFGVQEGHFVCTIVEF